MIVRNHLLAREGAQLKTLIAEYHTPDARQERYKQEIETLLLSYLDDVNGFCHAILTNTHAQLMSPERFCIELPFPKKLYDVPLPDGAYSFNNVLPVKLDCSTSPEMRSKHLPMPGYPKLWLGYAVVFRDFVPYLLVRSLDCAEDVKPLYWGFFFQAWQKLNDALRLENDKLPAIVHNLRTAIKRGDDSYELTLMKRKAPYMFRDMEVLSLPSNLEFLDIYRQFYNTVEEELGLKILCRSRGVCDSSFVITLHE